MGVIWRKRERKWLSLFYLLHIFSRLWSEMLGSFYRKKKYCHVSQTFVVFSEALWDPDSGRLVVVGYAPVLKLLKIDECVWASCANQVAVIEGENLNTQVSTVNLLEQFIKRQLEKRESPIGGFFSQQNLLNMTCVKAPSCNENNARRSSSFHYFCLCGCF